MEKEQISWVKKIILDLIDISAFLIFITWIILFIKFIIATPFTVIWQSMEPTFHEKDFLIVDKLSSKFNEIQRGDVIIFMPPWVDVPYIKRVIWLPWEIVKIQDWKVYICKKDSNWESCKELKEPYLKEWEVTKPSCGIKEFVVTWGYFVLGDNRNHSTDSRCCFRAGCFSGSSYVVPKENIIGKPILKLFPSIEKY